MGTASAAPRVSFVVGSRNDDHGGNPGRRLELAMAALAALCARHHCATELVIVEWNTPADRPPLAEVLAWPAEPGPLAIRVLTVPPHLHRRIANAERVPFFQMLAKNVGIRRARGAFVIATNIDLLFSEALVWFLAEGPLDPAAVYRVDRLDVRLRDLPPGLDVDEQLALCSLNVGRVCTDRGTIERPAAELRARYGHVAAPWPGFAPGELARLLAGAERATPHFEACGDFTMLAAERWHDLRAYPELPLSSMHQDSIFLKLALVSGVKQIVLPDPMRIYHIEHGGGWGVAEDRPHILASFPQLGDRDAHEIIAALAVGGPMTPNDDDWGFAAEDLAEWRYQPAAVGSRAAVS